MKKQALYIVLSMGTFLWSVQAIDTHQKAESRSLRLDPLIRAVLRRNPSLAAARFRLRAASIAVPRVQVLDDPDVKVRSKLNAFSSKTSFLSRIDFEVSQKIPFPGKLRLQGEIASWQRAVVKNEEIATFRDLISQSKILYFQLYFNWEAQQINKRNRRIVSRFIDATLALFTTGKGEQKDVLKAQVEYQDLVEELLPLKSEQAAIKAQINALLDRRQSAFIGLPEAKFSAPKHLRFKELEALAIQNSPELEALRAMVKEEEAVAKLAKRNYWPDFTFSGLIQHATSGMHDNAWGLGVSFNLPIRINQRQRREMEEALARSDANLHSFYALRATIRGQIREIIAKLRSLNQSIKLYKTGLISKTIKTLESAEAKYQVGEGDFLFILDTRRQLQNFELEYLRAKIHREIVFAELERVIGLTFEEMEKIDKKNGLVKREPQCLLSRTTLCETCRRSRRMRCVHVK